MALDLPPRTGRMGKSRVHRLGEDGRFVVSDLNDCTNPSCDEAEGVGNLQKNLTVFTHGL